MASNALSSTPSSSTPIEKSLQRLRPRQHDAPACHARRCTGTNCSSSPSRRTRKCDDSFRVAMAASASVLNGHAVKYCANAYEAAEGADALVTATEWNE